MNRILAILFALTCGVSFAQERLIPLEVNPYIKGERHQERSNNTIDSTFQTYNYSNLDLPVWDDFSINKFVDYDIPFTAPNVSSVQYFYLMNSGNTAPMNPSDIWCDSTHSRVDTVVIQSGISETNSTNFTDGTEVLINNLSVFPVVGETQTLYNQCYILIDSIINGIADPVQDTIWFDTIPDFRQDSARVFSANMTDPNTIWIDNYACHNYRYAMNPPSLGVVTFDGVSNDGYPYAWGAIDDYGYADALTSKPINLAGKTNVFLSFLYQAKGYGNSPEGIDSLFLELYDPVNQKWYRSMDFAVGGDVMDNEWNTAHIAITQSVLLVDGFQFRLRNKATLTGVLDHWHIDYVNLRDNSTAADIVIDDLAIMEPITSLLTDYSAVPWDHYSNLADPNSVIRSSYSLKVSNNHTTAKIVSPGKLDVNGTPFVLPQVAANWEVGINTYSVGVGNQPYAFPQIFSGDTMASFDVKLNMSTSSSNVRTINDTTYFTQEFKNFYAYDDGSAETAYGLDVYNAKLAYKFEAYEADTLAGVLMKFIPSNENVSGEIFLLTIWADDDGEPGEIIYQDDFFSPHYPNYAGRKDEFQYYKFNNNQFVSVPKSFYVGWEQIENQMLYIGMDLNTDNSDKIFYNTGGSWINTTYQGSLIIRPVFSTGLNNTLGIVTPSIAVEQASVSVFPNPTNGIVNISGLTANDRVVLTDISGRVVYEDRSDQINIEGFTKGIYIVQVYNDSNKLIYSDKLVKY